MEAPAQSVAKPPGSTIVTWMPSPATSFDQDLAEPGDCELRGLVRAQPGGPPRRPPIELICRMRPLRCRRITGNTARVTYTTP